MKLQPYEHRVQYYETDQMKVVHHSNYIRWFEEARTDFMQQIGMPYEAMEKEGILCPVLEASARYLRMLRFGDTARIELFIKEYNGIKLVISYQVINARTNMVHCKGETAHCFLTELGKPISLKKTYPDYHEKFIECMEDSKKRLEEKQELNSGNASGEQKADEEESKKEQQEDGTEEKVKQPENKVDENAEQPEESTTETKQYIADKEE